MQSNSKNLKHQNLNKPFYVTMRPINTIGAALQEEEQKQNVPNDQKCSTQYQIH